MDRLHTSTQAQRRAQLGPDPPNGCEGSKTRGPTACKPLSSTKERDRHPFWGSSKVRRRRTFLREKTRTELEINKFSRRRRTYIRVPKTDLGYLGFHMSGGVAIRIALRGARRPACTPSDKLSGERTLAPTHREGARATALASGPHTDWNPPRKSVADTYFRHPEKCAAGALLS